MCICKQFSSEPGRTGQIPSSRPSVQDAEALLVEGGEEMRGIQVKNCGDDDDVDDDDDDDGDDGVMCVTLMACWLIPCGREETSRLAVRIVHWESGGTEAHGGVRTGKGFGPRRRRWNK